MNNKENKLKMKKKLINKKFNLKKLIKMKQNMGNKIIKK